MHWRNVNSPAKTANKVWVITLTLNLDIMFIKPRQLAYSVASVFEVFLLFCLGGWLLRIILTKRCKFYFDFLNEFLKKKIDIIHNCDFYFSLHGPAHPLPTLVKEQPLQHELGLHDALLSEIMPSLLTYCCNSVKDGIYCKNSS